MEDFECYLPLDKNKYLEKNRNTLAWILSKMVPRKFYYAVENVDFQVNQELNEGTYQKYQSLDDKTDGFYYTRYIKFGVGRAMMDSSMEVRNGHLTKEGVYPLNNLMANFQKGMKSEFLEYISMTREEFDEICDQFRPKHIWEKI